MLLACKDVDATKGPEAGITPSRVACEFGHEYIVDLLSGCMNHNHDILARGSYPRNGEDRSFVRGPFDDSKAYGIPSVKQGSLRNLRDESGGVCTSAFLEPAKNGFGASKDAIESAVNTGWDESEYNSSGNARDSLQKVGELSVAKPTLENERLPSIAKPTLKKDSLSPLPNPNPPTENRFSAVRQTLGGPRVNKPKKFHKSTIKLEYL
jgi:hypothetical protein